MNMNASPKKKILLCIPRIPFPLNSGGRIAMYDVLQLLSKEFELTLIIIDDCSENVKYVDEMKNFSNQVYFFSKSKIYFFANSILGLLYMRPLQVGYFYFKEIQILINSLESSHDLYFSFMIRTSSYGYKLKIKKIHYAIDSMFLNYLNSKKNTTSLLWKLIFMLEIPLLFKIEKKHILKYNITTFVNKEEASYWETFGSSFNLPHGISNELLQYNKYDEEYNNAIVFIGRMDYQPNIDAIVWFCNNVFQFLSKEIRLLIIGGFPTNDVKQLEHRFENIKVLGFVNDPNIILKSCICTIAPMQSGGGLQTKILMSMALNNIVVLTTLSSKAIIGAENGKNMFIEDEPHKIASIINKIHGDPKSFQSVRIAAKELIENNYSLNIIEKKLSKLINDLI